jgi:hypothetical protein
VKKIYKKMYLLERGKYMQPKYTSCFADLVQELNININYDTISECSSVGSNFTLRKLAEQEGEEMQSRQVLKMKANQLEQRQKEKRQCSPLSGPRSRQFVRFSVDNGEEGEYERDKKMAESMFNPDGEEKPKKRKRLGAVMDLKELRGTARMPRL